jgi:hypothetical protein
LPSLNVDVPALKMIHAKDVQKVQRHQKSSNKCTIWYWMTGAWNFWDNRHFKRTCRIYFAWRIGYEKVLRKMVAALAHSRSNTHSRENLWTVLGAFWPRPTTLLPPRSNGKPEAASAVVELLMMGIRMPETCWAVFKQVTNLRNYCIDRKSVV